VFAREIADKRNAINKYWLMKQKTRTMAMDAQSIPFQPGMKRRTRIKTGLVILMIDWQTGL
jgi:hypothetical protein